MQDLQICSHRKSAESRFFLSSVSIYLRGKNVADRLRFRIVTCTFSVSVEFHHHLSLLNKISLGCLDIIIDTKGSKSLKARHTKKEPSLLF